MNDFFVDIIQYELRDLEGGYPGGKFDVTIAKFGVMLDVIWIIAN